MLSSDNLFDARYAQWAVAKWHDNNNDMIKKRGVDNLVMHSRPTLCVCVCCLIVIIRNSMNDMLGSLKIAAEWKKTCCVFTINRVDIWYACSCSVVLVFGKKTCIWPDQVQGKPKKRDSWIVNVIFAYYVHWYNNLVPKICFFVVALLNSGFFEFGVVITYSMHGTWNELWLRWHDNNNKKWVDGLVVCSRPTMYN